MAYIEIAPAFQDALTALRDAIATDLNWSCWDDQSGLATNPYIVMRGSLTDGTIVYLRILNPKNWQYLTFTCYKSWDSVNHTGTTPSGDYRVYLNQTAVTATSVVNFWISVTGDRLIILFKGSLTNTSYVQGVCYLGLIEKYHANDTTSGACLFACTGYPSDIQTNMGVMYTGRDLTDWSPCMLVELVFMGYNNRSVDFVPDATDGTYWMTPVVVFERSSGFRGRLKDLWSLPRNGAVADLDVFLVDGSEFLALNLRTNSSSAKIYYSPFPMSMYSSPSSQNGCYAMKKA